MKCIVRDLYDKNQTGSEMYRLIHQYADDLKGIVVVINGTGIPFSDLSLIQAFDVIRSIPYRQDKEPVEVVTRPKYINNETGADCKKKSILMASYLKLNGFPFRLVAVSNMPDKRVHHVFTQGYIDNRWENLDPTYPECKPFEDKKVTNFEVLK